MAAIHWLEERKKAAKRPERKEAYISKPKIYDRLIVTILPNTR